MVRAVCDGVYCADLTMTASSNTNTVYTAVPLYLSVFLARCISVLMLSLALPHVRREDPSLSVVSSSEAKDLDDATTQANEIDDDDFKMEEDEPEHVREASPQMVERS